MTNKTTNPFMQDNQDYVKLRSDDGKPPREQVAKQSLPDYQRWTTAELREHALGLLLEGAATAERQELIDMLGHH